jgi:addiction module HigA family antidote
MNGLKCIHPGEVLSEDFMIPHGLTKYRVAKDIGVPPIRVSQIVNGKRSISADTALRLSRYFGTSAEIWLRLQARYDLEMVDKDVGKKIFDEVCELKHAV